MDLGAGRGCRYDLGRGAAEIECERANLGEDSRGTRERRDAG